MLVAPRVLGDVAALVVVVVVVTVGAIGGASCVPPEVPPVVEGDGGRWEELAPLAEGPRQETATVALRGDVVVIGGFNGLGGVVTLVEAYDPVGELWRRLLDVPVALHHANAGVVDGKLVIAGFLTSIDFRADPRVFIFNLDENAWSEGSRMPAGTDRGASGTAVHDGFVYVIGGSQGTSVALSSRYHLETDTWEELPNLPVALDHLGAVPLDGQIFVVGGRSNSITSHVSSVFSFDPATNAWTERAPMITSRGGFGIGVVGDEIVVVGGEGNSAAPNGVFPQTEAYDPATDTWRALVPMRTPRHGMGATVVSGALYVPGGATTQGFGAVDTFERFVPESR